MTPRIFINFAKLDFFEEMCIRILIRWILLIKNDHIEYICISPRDHLFTITLTVITYIDHFLRKFEGYFRGHYTHSSAPATHTLLYRFRVPHAQENPRNKKSTDSACTINSIVALGVEHMPADAICIFVVAICVQISINGNVTLLPQAWGNKDAVVACIQIDIHRLATLKLASRKTILSQRQTYL